MEPEDGKHKPHKTQAQGLGRDFPGSPSTRRRRDDSLQAGVFSTSSS